MLGAVFASAFVDRHIPAIDDLEFLNFVEEGQLLVESAFPFTILGPQRRRGGPGIWK